MPMETITANESAKNASSDQTVAIPKNNNDIIYKIQILTSDKKLSEKDKRFKGYDEISYYVEKGIYKYTYGSTSDYKKILNMNKKAAQDFKGAFIIRTKDGQRVY